MDFNDRVDVWRVQLDQLEPATQVNNVLSLDELTRANRFHFERDRLHFIRCRIALRSLLGRYLGMPPFEIRLDIRPTVSRN
jgi:4'-phosphopantetheinyl transferase